MEGVGRGGWGVERDGEGAEKGWRWDGVFGEKGIEGVGSGELGWAEKNVDVWVFSCCRLWCRVELVVGLMGEAIR